MKKFLIAAAVAAAATLSIAAPAAAQYSQGRYEQRDQRGWGNNNQRGYGHNNNVNRQAVNQLLRDLDRAENQIQRSVDRRRISQRWRKSPRCLPRA